MTGPNDYSEVLHTVLSTKGLWDPGVDHYDDDGSSKHLKPKGGSAWNLHGHPSGSGTYELAAISRSGPINNN